MSNYLLLNAAMCKAKPAERPILPTYTTSKHTNLNLNKTFISSCLFKIIYN